MKAFRYFLLIIEVAVSIGFILLALGFVDEFPTDAPNQLSKLGVFTTEDTYPSDSSTKQVSIYDQGLQMMRGNYAVPSDWLLQQDVYTHPFDYGYNSYDQYTNPRNRFMVSFNGSQGEIIRCQEHYGNYQWGKATDFKNFKGEVDSLFRVGLLSHLDNLVLSDFSANNPTEARYLTNYIKIDSMYQYLEASFTGELEDKDYEGIVRIVYPNLTSSVNVVSVSVILAPSGTLSEVLKTENQIAFSYQANPAFEQYWTDTRRWHQQYIDQADNYYIPEKPGWHPDSAYHYAPMSGWEEYQNREKITPSY